MYKFYIIIALFLLVVLPACGGNTTLHENTLTPLASDLPETLSISSDELLLDVEPQPSSTPLFPTITPTPTSTPTPWIPMPLIGSEPHHPEREDVLTSLSDSGAQIVRFNGVLWYKIEPQEGQFNWASLRHLDSALQELATRDIEVILIVRGTPGWAQKVYGSACGPVAELKFQAFADFISELVRRYSVPPYNVKYWELGNEPDVAPELVAADSVFGCWGDSQDPYYGGGYYAEMLKVVYPAIKTADPEAQVLIGGLLLSCDSYFPPEGKDCLSSQFFNGILANQGAEYFDIVSFHGYPPFRKSHIWDDDFPGWNHRGGVVVGKIDYLRYVMEQYKVDKPIFLTESSLICPEWNITDCRPPDEHFFDVQADYVVRLFVRNWALDIAGTIWYQFEGQGWRYGGLVGDDPNYPKPAFQAFNHLVEKLTDMTYIGIVPAPEGVQGYIFSGEDHQTWVLWSGDESPQTFELPQNILFIYDKFGQIISHQGAELTISSPIYIDVKP